MFIAIAKFASKFCMSLSPSSQKQGSFFFGSLDLPNPLTARKVHIRRLYDILQLCIHRDDLERATRAWSILVRCKEVPWMTMWTTGLLLIDTGSGEEHRTSDRLEYLRAMMLRHQEEREKILTELVVQLIQLGRHREALDELELYLPSFPYQDNPVLHIYAGLICLYLAQPLTPDSPFNVMLLRDAQSHFEHAQGVDPDNKVARGFLEKIPQLSESLQNRESTDVESEDEDKDMAIDDSSRRKRVRK
ncbi:hypothetical protein E4T56_gene19496 [Termitomyces sp. T112]|nr:hypothetical protein E4T56_gene19496 [Termitomyces sp. T112]